MISAFRKTSLTSSWFATKGTTVLIRPSDQSWFTINISLVCPQWWAYYVCLPHGRDFLISYETALSCLHNFLLP
jgi:hypothetical protein